MTGLVRLWSGWERFWFEPQPTSTVALFRVGFGLLTLAWTATLIPDLYSFFGSNGILPEKPATGRGEWGLLFLSDSRALLLGVFVATMCAALALTVGLYTRLAATVVWVGILAFEHRNPFVMNSGDLVVRDLAFFCVLAPAGVALSLDRLRKARDRFWEFPARAPWALRLIQIQVSVGYLSAVWHKVSTEAWNNGTAVSYALHIEDLRRLHVPAFVTQSVVLTNVLTFGTLAVELAIGVLVWNRRARPWVLIAGVSLHLGIDATLMVGFFSFAMLTSYLAFVPPETATRFILASRDLAKRLLTPGIAGRRRRSSGPPDAQHEHSDTEGDGRGPSSPDDHKIRPDSRLLPGPEPLPTATPNVQQAD